MEIESKLSLLNGHIDLELADEPLSAAAHGPIRTTTIDQESCPPHPGIFQAAITGGKHVPLLKTLLTSFCERNCFYCPFRQGRDMPRETFKPDTMADLFLQMHRKKMVQGLFLSSGISGGGVRSQDKLIDTIEILRRKHRFSGYVHLKLLPGAEEGQLLRAMQLSDRVSINLEAPNQSRLDALAPRKQFEGELLQPLHWAEQIRRTQPPETAWKGRWPSLATQFVVGAVGESDLELLSTSAGLLQQLSLARVYFSPFKPVTGTPLENHHPEKPLRTFRLFQASFLLRDYGFNLEELEFHQDGQLPLHLDPKRAWADHHLKDQPLEINHAERSELMRLPGVGPKRAENILSARRKSRFASSDDLLRAGVPLDPILPYILLDGRRPAHQPSLW